MRKMDEKAAKAREDAWSAARQLASENRLIAESLMRAAEMDVLRKIAADYLDDGEEGYWRMVEREIIS